MSAQTLKKFLDSNGLSSIHDKLNELDVTEVKSLKSFNSPELRRDLFQKLDLKSFGQRKKLGDCIENLLSSKELDYSGTFIFEDISFAICKKLSVSRPKFKDIVCANGGTVVMDLTDATHLIATRKEVTTPHKRILAAIFLKVKIVSED